VTALRTGTPGLLVWILYQLEQLNQRVNELQGLVMTLLQHGK
jgi:hypothetical protein